MERHAFMAKLNPGCRDQYIDAHRNVPPDLLARYRQAGIRNLSVLLQEDLLFLCLESDDYDAALAALENDPTEREGQRLMSPMLDASGYRECVETFHME